MLSLIILISQMVPGFAITASEATGLMADSPTVAMEVYNGVMPSQKVIAATNNENFEDIKSADWYYKDVMEARKAGLIAGVGNNRYAPNSVITYAEYITILARILDNTINTKPEGKNWYDKYIEYARENGIIGNNEGIDVMAGIPREEIVRFTCKALKIEPYSGNEIIFGDVKAGDVEYINAAYKEYLTEGSGRLNSGQKKFGIGELSTRAQLATMANRVMSYKNDPIAYKAERAKAREVADKAYEAEKARLSQPQQFYMGYTAPPGYGLMGVKPDGGLQIGVYGDITYELNVEMCVSEGIDNREKGIYWVREVIKSKFGAEIANRVIEIGERFANGNYLTNAREIFEAQGYRFEVRYGGGQWWAIYISKKIRIWRYFMSYWNNRRICSANGGLPPMVKRKKYYEGQYPKTA